MATYLPANQYENLIRTLSALQPDPITGEIDHDAIKLVIGEAADIWPSTISQSFGRPRSIRTVTIRD